MKKADILRRVNQKVHEGLYSYEDIVDELDDSIDRINDTLSSTYPYFSDILVDDVVQYKYDVAEEGEEEELVPIFPFQYIKSVCIPYVACQLMRREDEFGALYQTHMAEFDTNLQIMFRDHYNDIPEQFEKSADTGVIAMNPGPVYSQKYDRYAPHNYGPTPDEEDD